MQKSVLKRADEPASRDELEEVTQRGRADVRLLDVSAEVLVDDRGVAAFHRTVGCAVDALGGVHGRPVILGTS